jgi:molybdopterin-guanine dinucleotide biosynthesis protein A
MTAVYRGSPLVHHAIGRLSGVCDDVVVVLAPGDPGEGLPPGVRVVNDTSEGDGPLAGLHAGMMAAIRSERVVVAGGDMPEMSEAVLTEMLRVLEGSGADAVALSDGGRPRPLPVALRTWPAADAVHTLLHAGRRRLRDVLDALTTAVIDEATWTQLDPERGTLVDIDTPEDLPS